jgi:beta-lactamase superfamily II metal-dependent hydrolase
MKLQIFDVEHGACALLTCDNNTRLMIDCGYNASTGWRPGTYLQNQGIRKLEMLAITNYDEDHADAANNLFDKISVQWLLRNPSVSAQMIRHLKSEDRMGPGIERLVYEIERNFNGLGGSESPPNFQGLEYKYFYNDYPLFDDENNLSLALLLKCHGRGVMFTGDLEKAGWRELLKREEFRAALQQTNVLVASHHGRESGCCDEMIPYFENAFYVVISDKGYAHETQETIPFYRRIAKGGPFRDDTRRVLTTRNDGGITFHFHPQSWWPD